MYRTTLIALLLVGCADREPPIAVPATPPVARPVALFGEWLRIAPRELRGDTLVLRADSAASALWPWQPDSLARITRWELRLLCVMAGPEEYCQKFHYVAPDSLSFTGGLRYVRIRRTATGQTGPTAGG